MWLLVLARSVNVALLGLLGVTGFSFGWGRFHTSPAFELGWYISRFCFVLFKAYISAWRAVVQEDRYQGVGWTWER
jgi:hypothetical protein